MIEAELLEAAARLRRDFADQPVHAAVILGSGLSFCTAESVLLCGSAYAAIPSLPTVPVVPGHGGELQIVSQSGRLLLLFCGRFHLYQGLSAWQATTPVRLACALGARRILLTSAVGGIRSGLQPGDLFCTTDHLNLCGATPLAGLTPPAFVDLSRLYRRDLYDRLPSGAKGRSPALGTLAFMPGPAYETPAEIRALEKLGADAVGMSLVPEALMAAALGMEVAALSLVTNRAAGLGGAGLSHDEVLAAARSGAGDFAAAAGALLERWG